MNDFTTTVAMWLADYFLLSGVLLVLTLAVLTPLKQPAQRLAVTKSTLVALLLLAALCSIPGWSLIHLLSTKQPRPNGSPVVAHNVQPANEPAPIIAPPVDNAAPSQPAKPIVLPEPAPSRQRFWNNLSWPTIFASTYAFGALVVVVWLCLGAIAARRLVQSAQPAPADLTALIFEVAGKTVSRAELMTTHRIDVAVALGLWRPVVLLPRAWVESQPQSDLRSVLAHELAHVTNHDLRWLAASRTLLILLWPQPLFWFLRHRMRLDQEALADAAAAEVTGRQTYAEQLVAWAHNIPPRPAVRLSAAIGLWEGPSQLRQRIALLLDERLSVLRECSRKWRVASLVGCALVAAGLSVVTLEQPRSAAHGDESERSATSSNDTQTQAAGRPKARDYTAPVIVSGRATDKDGKPIADATIHLASPRTNSQPLAVTKTNERGAYRFENVALPIKPADTNAGEDVGCFEVFGTADGYGMAWRPLKWFYPNSAYVDGSVADPAWDQPDRYGRDDPIELDLQFGPPATLRGRIVNDLDEPIAESSLAIRNGKPFGDERDLRQLESFNERALVPASVKLRQTDSAGRFEFTGLPADHQFSIDIRPPGHPPRRIWAATQEGSQVDRMGTRIYSGKFDVVFPRPRNLKLRIVYGDTSQPAAKVGIGGNVAEAGFWETTDENGVVDVLLPDGAYKLGMFPQYGSPYLRTDVEVVVSAETATQTTTLQLRPAAVADITVVDADTGKPLSGVDVWLEEEETNPNRRVYGYRSWEVETRISRYESPRTDDNGKMRVLFEPGKRRIGVALDAFPVGYEPVEPNGKAVDLSAGSSQTVAFQLRNTKPAKSPAAAASPPTNDVPAANQPIDIPIVVAKHVMLHDGKIIEWADVERMVAALPNPKLARPGFYFTSGALPDRQEEIRPKIFDLHKRMQLSGHSWGSILPRTSFRYDAIRTAADLVPNEAWRVNGTVETVDGLPIDGAEVVLFTPVAESLPYKLIDIYLRNERLRQPFEEVVTTSDNSGRFALYPPPETPYYVVALHKEGFSLARSDDFSKTGHVKLMPWAHIRGRVKEDARFKQSASATEYVPESDGWPHLIFHQYSEDLGPASPDGRFEFAFIPPRLKGSLSRSIEAEQGRSYSLPVEEFELDPTETLVVDIRPPSDKEASRFESLKADGEQSQKGAEVESADLPVVGVPVRVRSGRLVDEDGKPVAGGADKTLLPGR